MTFEEYWGIKVRANAGLKDEGATMKMTVEAFKRQMRQAYFACHRKSEETRPGEFFEYLKKAVGK